ncbi:CHASE2 domain-containing protein, partial [Neorhizobium galegae]
MGGGRGLSFSARRHFSSRRIQVAVLAAFFFGAAGLIARLPAWPLIDYRAFDYLSTVWAEPLAEGGVIIVAIDEPSLAEINMQWPWPR